MIDLIPIIQSEIKSNSDHLRTCVPAKVVSVDYAAQEIVAQVLIKKRDFNGDLTDLVPIVGVPIFQLGASNGQFSVPVAPGDLGLLLVTDRSMDRYLYSDGTDPIDPADRKTHDLSSCVFIPGVYPYPVTPGTTPNLVVMRHNAGTRNAQNPGESRVAIHPTGDAEAIQLSANRYTADLADITIYQDGRININANDGTNIDLVQGGKVTINTPTEVEVNCATADINCSGNATIDAAQIQLNGAGGGVLTTESINPITGTPYPDGSTTVLAGDG